MMNVELLPAVSSKGNLSLLDEPLTALFCSNRCPGDLILKTYDLARAMRDAASPSSEASKRQWSANACAYCYGAISP